MAKKHASIWALVARLAPVFGGQAFRLVDHREPDLCAIGFANPTIGEARLVYITAFGKAPERFGYEYEERDATGAPPRACA